jgi:hypothetical protein
LPLFAVFGFEGVFFGISLLAGVIPHSSAQPNPSAILWFAIPSMLLFLPVLLFLYGLYYGASTYAALQADLGLKVTAGQAIRHGWSRIGRYTGLILLRSLIIILPLFALVVIAGALVLLLGLSHNINGNMAAMFILFPLGGLCYFAYLVYAVYMTLRFSLALPACVHESLSATQALKRSSLLTFGAKGRIFLILLIIYAISSAAFLVVYLVGILGFALVAALGAGNLEHPGPFTIALLALAGIAILVFVLLWSALLMSAYSTAFAVFYRDQRLRKEGIPPAAPAFSPALDGAPLL